MHTPKVSEFYEMELNDHAGPESLDAIATRVYGRPYKGQQTGDMLPNDSWHEYLIDDEAIAQSLADRAEKRVYLGVQRVPQGKGDWGSSVVNHYVEGVDEFEYWLSLKSDPATSYEGYNPPQEWEDARGFVFRNDFEVYRKAPDIHSVLCDLVHRGELPKGRYLIHCWW